MSYVAGGCSTYSKVEFTHLPNYPDYLYGGEGAVVWNYEQKYIDFTCSLGAISLGYTPTENNPCILLPLPTDSEGTAAMILCERTGWDQVRWCKNGSDATEAAVRLARKVTGRALVACNSYHGSHDTLVTATEGKRGGVLREAYETIRSFPTSQELLDNITEEVAAVIIEPRTWDRVWELAAIRAQCEQTGTLLIFDEMITGWRGRPGAHNPYVRPDLACYGKAIGNGEAIACVAGPRKLMQEFEKGVFMSGTYAAGERALSTCIVTLRSLDEEHFDRMRNHCEMVGQATKDIAKGYPGRLHITLPKEQHDLFVDGLAARGYLVGRDFFFMRDHTEEQVQGLCQAIGEVRNELGI